MSEASHVKFAPVCHHIVQVHMYENVTYGPSHIKVALNAGMNHLNNCSLEYLNSTLAVVL